MIRPDKKKKIEEMAGNKNACLYRFKEIRHPIGINEQMFLIDKTKKDSWHSWQLDKEEYELASKTIPQLKHPLIPKIEKFWEDNLPAIKDSVKNPVGANKYMYAKAYSLAWDVSWGILAYFTGGYEKEPGVPDWINIPFKDVMKWITIRAVYPDLRNTANALKEINKSKKRRLGRKL